jgi:hypothetical protein
MSTSTDGTYLHFENDGIRFRDAVNDGTYRKTTALYRDNSAWSHILLNVDTTQVSASDRIKLYVNGIQLTDFSTTNNPTQNDDLDMNTIEKHLIGAYQASSLVHTFEGELTDIFMIDGQALTPDVFGFYKQGNGYISAGSTQSTDFRPGQWVPKTPRIIKTEINRRGGFGVNGYYLPMNDSSNFGADFHCAPNSIIKLQEDLPQPKVSIASTTNAAGLAYTDVLRADPYANDLVLAVPGIGTIRDYSPFINSTLSGVGMTATIDDAGGGIDVGLGTVSVYYGESIYKPVRDGSTIDYTPRTSSTAYGDQWTIEFWCNILEPNAAYQVVYHHADTASWNNGIVLSRHNTNDTWTIWANGTSNCTGGLFTSVLNSWQHIAAVRDGSKLSLFQNGVCIGINTNYSGTDTTSAGREIGILGEPGTNNFASRGYIQDLRVYIGTAKYTGGFDVPKPYTPVGIATWRAVPDTTANNFATLNPLQKAVNAQDPGDFTDGNLTVTYDTSTNHGTTTSNVGIGTTGKWYVEARINSMTISGGFGFNVGVTGMGKTHTSGAVGFGEVGVAYQHTGVKRVLTAVVGSSTTSLYGSSYTSGDIIGIGVSNGDLTFYKNGTSQGIAYTGITTFISNGQTDDLFFGCGDLTSGAGGTISWNFGQNPTFSGNTTAGTFTDSNGKGLFKYEPPSGFLALCEDNLPTPAIKNPGEYFKTVLWTGDGNNGRSITGVGFQPDFVWTKGRGSATYNNHLLYDSVRGTTKILQSNQTADEVTATTGLSSFDYDGFTIGTFEDGNTNANTYVAWCWRAGAGTTSINTDGSIDSVVSVNQTAGFSIVSYTGTSSAGTVGHELGKIPAFIIVKKRSDSVESNWTVYHKSLGNTKRLFLNLTNAESTNSATWNDTTPTSSLFSLGGSTYINDSGETHIAYCWAEIEGFSKFGSYVANNSTDGPFVYCGFKPAWVLVKNTTTTGTNWELIDNVRSSSNGNNAYLIPNDTGQEYSTEAMDFLSNGFKLRTTSSGWNSSSGNTYIFAAFAESPFSYSNSK